MLLENDGDLQKLWEADMQCDYGKRCDKFPNCGDFSYEEHCKTVVLHDSYVKN